MDNVSKIYNRVEIVTIDRPVLFFSPTCRKRELIIIVGTRELYPLQHI